MSNASQDVQPIPECLDSIARTIIDASLTVHKALGPGLLESVYETCLAYELGQRGLIVDRQATLPIVYKGITIDDGLRIDLLIEKSVIVELKSIDKFIPLNDAQLITYLKLSGLRLGLLINFNVRLLKDGIRRIAVKNTYILSICQ